MLKKILALFMACVLSIGLIGCDKKSNLPKYSDKQFELSGFWAPYEISEESFKQYKDIGFTKMLFINHSLPRTPENHFYLGSERTMKALEMCRKVGLKAIISYNDWLAKKVTKNEDYSGDTPFSKYDLYGDYKDIITGVHICDEPYVINVEIYGKKVFIDDFKKVYPNAKFVINLAPYTAYERRGFESYEQMMQMYEETFMEPFEKPFVSVDVYPFHEGMEKDDKTLAYNYNFIANSAKKYGIKPEFILQSSVGGGEFEMELSESDLRWEINSALAFGAGGLQYYCYSVPKDFDENGNETGNMYDYCILKQDNTPSDVYYTLQKLHKEIQSFADVILSYDWDKSIGVSGYKEMLLRVNKLQYTEDGLPMKFENAKHYVQARATRDLLVSRFESEEYGEAYMLTNFTDRGNTNNIELTLKDCNKLAIYGGAEWSTTPEIVEVNEDGKLLLDLAYGEAVFITPIL